MILKFRRFLWNYSVVMNGEGAVREACERLFRPRFRMPNHARDAPQPLRINFGEIENLRFRNFGTGREIWAALALPLALAAFRVHTWVAP